MVSTHLKNISQIGSFPQVGVKIQKKIETTTQIIWPVSLVFPTEALFGMNSHHSTGQKVKFTHGIPHLKDKAFFKITSLPRISTSLSCIRHVWYMFKGIHVKDSQRIPLGKIILPNKNPWHAWGFPLHLFWGERGVTRRACCFHRRGSGLLLRGSGYLVSG